VLVEELKAARKECEDAKAEAAIAKEQTAAAVTECMRLTEIAVWYRNASGLDHLVDGDQPMDHGSDE